MPRVAYVITSHRLPEQVRRLVRTLRELSPAAEVLVHHDGPQESFGAIAIPPVPRVEWGRGTQLDMLLRCLRFAVARVEFDWLVLLSGQDYPVRPLEEVERELGAAPFDGFAEGHVVEPPPWSRAPGDEFARRYFYAWLRAPAPPRVVSAARPLLAVREVPSGTLLGVRRRGPGVRVHRGSDWLTLSRQAAEVVARDRPRLVRYFRRTVLPTEAYPHTVLHGAPGLRLSGDVRRFTRWLPGYPHPETLGIGDLDELLASGTDFARKFDMTVDGRILDELDRALGVRRVTGS